MKYVPLFACLVFFAFSSRAAETPVDAQASGFSGKVLETTNTAGYTYVFVNTGSNKVWAVTTQFPVNVGDKVIVGSGVPMTNYHSKTLNRDFDVVYFTGGISVNGAGTGAAPALPSGHPSMGGDAAGLPTGHPSLTVPANIDLTGIKRAPGGKTIQEIYAAQAELAGKSVSVRGKVVKYNSGILGKNWLHIRDGSGANEKGNNDLTVTTSTTAKLGDTVLVAGNVSTNRNFGGGYKYDVIIEDAQVTAE